MTPADLVREARRGLGLTAAELSRRCSEIDGRPARSWARTISEIESGRLPGVAYPTLATIAEACGGHLWVVRTGA